jgi:2-keto-4-pentenoate hydratase/2-oxohepta-3-ene-1,7-dioic acid hydratase in catechol pathway
VVEGDQVRDVSAALKVLPTARYPYPTHDVLIANLAALRQSISALPDDGIRFRLGDLQMHSPIANPGKLIAAPVNYQAHLEEAIADRTTFSREHIRKIQETGLFLKATSSVIGSGESIQIAHLERRTDHEIELAVVIGTTGRAIKAADALNHVAGYTIGLDITLRGPEERSLRKSVDTYSVLGPWLVTSDELPDPSELDLLLSVDGVERQRANTRNLIINVRDLIVFASAFYTLYPGDVIYTGTPEGVGPIHPKEKIRAQISNVGAFEIVVGAL